MIKKISSILFLAIIASSCNQIDESKIHGEWQAVQLQEENKSLPIDLSFTKFSFNDKGEYTYQTNVNYKEAGIYTLNSKHLTTQDTLKKTNPKSVLIEFSSPDSITLKMNKDGKKQILSLKKVR